MKNNKHYLCIKLLKMRIAITLVFAFVAILSISCKRDGNTTSTDNASAPVNTTAPAAAPNAGGVKHYICPNNCTGSGGDVAGNCPVCGTEYTHNDAFHNQGSPTAPTIQAPQSPGMQQPTVTPPTPAAAEPAQNAAGVWHWVCGKGCAGGSGSAGNCSKCGGALTHNDAYHQ